MTWHDGVTGRTMSAEVPHATLDSGRGRRTVVAEARVGGSAVTLDATAGHGRAADRGVAGPWPVKLAARLGDATLALDGTADPAARSLSGRLEASVPDLAQLGTLLQSPGWPPLHDMQLAATLPPAGGLPQDVTLQFGASDLGASCRAPRSAACR